MSPTGELSAEHYARRLLAEWERLSGRAVVLSEREWELMCDWHTRGVPAPLIEETMAEVVARRRTTPRSLTFIAQAVEESWRAVVDGRTAPAAERGRRPVEHWRRVAGDAATSAELGARIAALLDELDRGAAPAELDRRLDETIVGLVDPETLRAAEEAVDRRLAGFAGRLDPETLAMTRRRAVVERLRASLGLPRLVG